MREEGKERERERQRKVEVRRIIKDGRGERGCKREDRGWRE